MTKTILITGSTDGIGLLTAKLLAAEGHQILLHGRSADKLHAAAAEVGGNCETYQADLSSLAATRDLASEIRAKHQQIDVLINNAGVYKVPNAILPNGQDMRFVVNTLAPYLLSKELMDLIPADGRILNLSSAAQARVDVAALRGERQLDPMGAYAQSKLALTIWSAELAKTLPNGPAVIAVNPGSLLASKMVKEGFGVTGSDLRIGADILCRLALDPDHAGDSGKYWDNNAGRFAAPDAAAADPRQVSDVMAAIQSLI